MKVVMVCMQYEYGAKTRGYSYEYVNFYQVLQRMGHEVILFDFLDNIKLHGKDSMNQQLLQLVQKECPDLAFFSLYQDEIDPQTVQKIRDVTKTVCFFHDDTWRVTFSRFWASQFDYFTTPDVYGEYKYQQLGLSGAIHFPFGCNSHVFQKLDIAKTVDVSFVGAWHPYRAWLIDGLKKAGFQVEVAGNRWPNGTLSHVEMVRLFNQSKINLNMSNSVSYDVKYLCANPRALINTLRSPKNIEQIKARHYEISNCGAFQLSYYVEGLERQYVIGEEIGIYVDRRDLIEKVAFYLEHETLREQMAEKAHKRSLQDHQLESRFEQMFERMGFAHVTA